MAILSHELDRHDDVIKWKHFPRYWSFVRRIHRSPVNSPHKGQWRGASMFSLICAWINGWVNNHVCCDLWRRRAHYNVTVKTTSTWYYTTDISHNMYPVGLCIIGDFRIWLNALIKCHNDSGLSNQWRHMYAMASQITDNSNRYYCSLRGVHPLQGSSNVESVCMPWHRRVGTYRHLLT